MRIKGIPFKEPMIHALLDGRKTQTRRLSPLYSVGDRLWVREAWRTTDGLDKLSGSQIAKRCIEAGYKTPWCPIQYEADGAQTNWIASGHGFGTEAGRYRHARFMPRWASRLTLIVTDVRVQLLQEISEADARAEGAKAGDWPDRPHCSCDDDDCAACSHYPALHIPAFKHLWDSLHGPDEWDANPRVTAITFTVHKRNIDNLLPLSEQGH